MNSDRRLSERLAGIRVSLLKQQSADQETEQKPKKKSLLLDLPCVPKRAPSSALPEINFLPPPEELKSSNSSVSD